MEMKSLERASSHVALPSIAPSSSSAEAMEMKSPLDLWALPVEMVIISDPYRVIDFPVRFENLWFWILPHLDRDRIERVLELDTLKKKRVIPRMQFLIQAHDIVGEHIMKRAVEDMRAWERASSHVALPSVAHSSSSEAMEMKSPLDLWALPVEIVIISDPYRVIDFPVRFEDLWFWILPHLDRDRIERVLELDTMKKKKVIPRMQFLIQAHDIVGEHIMTRAVEDMRARASSSR